MLTYPTGNHNSFGVKCSLISLGGGGGGHSGHVWALTSLLVTSDFFFELKLQVCVMTKAVSNRDICFIKAVKLLNHRHFWLNFASHVPILLGVKKSNKLNICRFSTGALAHFSQWERMELSMARGGAINQPGITETLATATEYRFLNYPLGCDIFSADFYVNVSSFFRTEHIILSMRQNIFFCTFFRFIQYTLFCK